MARSKLELVPEFTAELEEIREFGISKELLYDIIQKHTWCSEYSQKLYERYMGIKEGVPIHNRQPRYEEEDNPINNKINIDHFGEIIDFKVGYFSGEPVSYSYNQTDEAESVTGGKEAVDKVIKALTDFLMRNNMHGVDMEITKNAAIYGYSGRLFFVKDGEIRVKAIHGYETIILSEVDISEPEYAIRYYKTLGVNDTEKWIVEFYDNKNVTIFKGSSLLDLEQTDVKEHLFDYCPLQGIANNAEKLGDAEKVLEAIDDYNKVMSDNSNEIEAFAHALLLVNLNTDDKTIEKAQKSGSLIIPPVGVNQNSDPVKWVTKNINDTFSKNHLERLESDIYSTTKTPNLKDATFGTASGEALRFKLHGLETKCATFEACSKNSNMYMWKVLCSAWAKQGISADPLQFSMEYTRNFPLELLKEAQTAQSLIAAGLPKRYAFSKISDIDDVDYIMELIKAEQEETMEMYPNLEKANKTVNEDDDEDDEIKKTSEEEEEEKEK